MNLEKGYERPYRRNEPKSSQNYIIKYGYCHKKSRYPQKLLITFSDKHDKMFILHIAECQYDLEFTCKNRLCGVATFYHATHLKNH